MGMVNIFEKIGQQIDSVANSVLSSVQSGYISGVLALAKVGAVLYVLVYGYPLDGARFLTCAFSYNISTRYEACAINCLFVPSKDA